MRGWVLQDSEIDALDLSDELKDFARDMAGESSVQLPSDRERILLTAALEVELYVGKAYFRGPGGSARACSTVLEVAAPFTAPAVGALPRSTGVTVSAVEIWDGAAEAFARLHLHPAGRLASSSCLLLARFGSSRACSRQPLSHRDR